MSGLLGAGFDRTSEAPKVESSIRQVPTGISHLAIITRGVEYAFVAAGVTVAAIAVFQSFGIVLNWIGGGG